MTQLGIDVGGGSVKVAAVRASDVLWTAQSGRYADPSAEVVSAAIRDAIAGRAADVTAVGLCVPGILNADHSAIELSVNLPRLNGLPLNDVVSRGLDRPSPPLRVMNDTTAAAYDLYFANRLTGRLFLMVLGTGVGVCVMDPDGPLRVNGDSPGHFGQMDVSIEGHPVVGPDGGAGSLEGYVGSAALASAYGAGPDALSAMRVDHAAGRAIVRALRIAHAMYRPDHIILAGGVGTRIGHLLPEIKAAVDERLTRIARPGWTIGLGTNDFHNAAGAARAVGWASPTDSAANQSMSNA